MSVDVAPADVWNLAMPYWIHALPGLGTGSAQVWYSALPNFRATPRTHVSTIGPHTFEFEQHAHAGTVDQRFEFNFTGRFVAGLYVGILNRDPEHGGWLFQRNALARGEVNQLQLVENFLNSQEYRTNFGNPANDQFVRNLYQYVLGRQPSTAEVAPHVTALQTGTSRAALASAFLNSAEFRARIGARLTSFLLYATILQRDGTQAERDAWAALINAGVPLRTILDGFLTSAEFRQVLD